MVSKYLTSTSLGTMKKKQIRGLKESIQKKYEFICHTQSIGTFLVFPMNFVLRKVPAIILRELRIDIPEICDEGL